MPGPRPFRGRHYASGQVVDVPSADGRIVAVAPSAGRPDDEVPWIAPALFDLQINGCDGHSFNSEGLTVESVGHVVRTCRRHGIGGLLPTLVTNDRESLLHGFRTLRRAREEDREVGRAVPGFH